MIGTGAISHKHAQAYANIGYELTVCTDINAESGRAFADKYGCQFVPSLRRGVPASARGLRGCLHISRFSAAAAAKSAPRPKKHVQVQKPMSTNLETAREMMDVARRAGIQLSVVSQHRFDDSTQFLRAGIGRGQAGTNSAGGRIREMVPLGRLLFAPDQRKLGYRRRRRADQPGRSIRWIFCCGWPARFRRFLVTGSWRVAQNRIGGRGVGAGEIQFRSNWRDSILHRILARIYGAHRDPRHQGDGGDIGR